MHENDEATLAGAGARLKELRGQRSMSLEEVSAATGISTSTLSRLENGARRPTLELMLPLARLHRVGLDDLVGAPEVGDPRARLRPVVRHGRTYLPLTRRAGGVRAVKVVVPPGAGPDDTRLRRHEGHQWIHVLSGRVLVVVRKSSVLLGPGEVVEFDTRLPHTLTNPDDVPCELLTIFGPQGERMRVRRLG